MANEFALIAEHLAPLARHPGARGLIDDVAVFTFDGPTLVTSDVIVESVHFLSEDPIDLVARKALRVNVSDVAAKGAEPIAYQLALQWPAARGAGEFAALARGLAADHEAFGLLLLGGDLTATPGPLALSVTMFGRPLGARTPSRADARVDDQVWVTGAIGDAWLGLAALTGDRAGLTGEDRAFVISRYRLPTPRTGFAAAIAAHANAAMDVSDGLLVDAAKIAAASGLAIRIDPGAVPLSAAAAAWVDGAGDRLAALGALFSGGDDYEILFTAPAAAADGIEDAGRRAGVRVARIGECHDGQGVEAGGLAIRGHVHRLGG